jgi:hypothetical protein
VIKLAYFPLRLALRVFKKQCNTLAMVTAKPNHLWPWLKKEDGRTVFDRDYARERFRVPDDPT